MRIKVKEENKKYYTKKGKGIYSDFLTFASSDKTLAECTAKEFLDKFGKRKEKPAVVDSGGETLGGTSPLGIAEFGVGNGNFAKSFLEYLEKEAPGLKVSYSLFDISEKMLSDARKNLGKLAGKCHFIKFDAHTDSLPANAFDFAILNELLCDLEAEVYEKGGKAPKDRKNAEWVHGFLLRIETGRKLPFNFAACEFFGRVYDSLKEGGVAHVFDYGFYFYPDIRDVEIGIWNESICRKYGMQITCDVNFPLLAAYMNAFREAKPRIER